MLNERKIKVEEKNESKMKKSKQSKTKEFESYEESRNMTCFNCEQKDHYANECAESKQMRKMKSSSIITQVILSCQNKSKENLIECVLSNSIVIATIIRSEEIKKKEMIQQAKEKRTILKRNERIIEEHDRYLNQQERNEKQTNKKNRNEFENMKAMSEMNQSNEFHDFNDDEKDQRMMKYSKEKSVTISQTIIKSKK